MRVLIVDDEILVRWSLSHILAKEGHTIFSASSGYEAMDIIDTENLDLAIIDIKLPDINGLELLKKIKELRSCTNAIVITAYDTDEIRKECELLKINSILNKPFNLDDIRKFINNII